MMSIVLPDPTTAFQINALLMYFGEDSLRHPWTFFQKHPICSIHFKASTTSAGGSLQQHKVSSNACL